MRCFEVSVIKDVEAGHTYEMLRTFCHPEFDFEF